MVMTKISTVYTILSTAFIFTFFSITPCFASTVQLKWDANTEYDLAGYKVYYNIESTPLAATIPVDVGNQTTVTISGLDPNNAYSFAITAYNTSGLESSFSNIVFLAAQTPSTAASTYPDLTIADALLALQIGSGKVTPAHEQMIRLDVAPVIQGISSPDGKVDTGDAIVLLSRIVAKPVL